MLEVHHYFLDILSLLYKSTYINGQTFYFRFEGVSSFDYQPIWVATTFQPFGDWEEISYDRAHRTIDKYIEEEIKRQEK